MKKPKQAKGDPDLRAEYDFSGGKRGTLARRFGKRATRRKARARRAR